MKYKKKIQVVSALSVELKLGQLQKVISEKWSNLSEEDKKIYVKMASEDKIRYEKEKATYVPEETEVEKESNKTVFPLGNSLK